MSIITLAAFGGGLVSGFVLGVLASESGKIKSTDLTNLSNTAIGKVKTAVTYLKNHEHRSQYPRNEAASA